uniref:Uncharacterized protein n=1 Tax=Romanomermis culicivorax TaxID=13658 RepID=A0A915L728_ROMCU
MISWACIVAYKLSILRHVIGITTVISFPICMVLYALFFVIVPALTTAKALTDIKVQDYRHEFHGIKLTMLVMWLNMNIAFYGMMYMGVELYKIRGSNISLKRTLLRYTYKFMNEDQGSVEFLNKLQAEYSCCGIENATSWLRFSKWHYYYEAAVPAYCCRSEYVGFCSRDKINLMRYRLDSINVRGCGPVINEQYMTITKPVAYFILCISLLHFAVFILLVIYVKNFEPIAAEIDATPAVSIAATAYAREKKGKKAKVTLKVVKKMMSKKGGKFSIASSIQSQTQITRLKRIHLRKKMLSKKKGKGKKLIIAAKSGKTKKSAGTKRRKKMTKKRPGGCTKVKKLGFKTKKGKTIKGFSTKKQFSTETTATPSKTVSQLLSVQPSPRQKTAGRKEKTIPRKHKTAGRSIPPVFRERTADRQFQHHGAKKTLTDDSKKHVSKTHLLKKRKAGLKISPRNKIKTKRPQPNTRARGSAVVGPDLS